MSQEQLSSHFDRVEAHVLDAVYSPLERAKRFRPSVFPDVHFLPTRRKHVFRPVVIDAREYRLQVEKLSLQM